MDLTLADPRHFDMAALFREDASLEVYLADDCCSSNPPSQMSTRPDGRLTVVSASDTRPATFRPAPQNKHRSERKGHTKSRRGCYNCKRRRIKCQETRPACGHCVKTGLRCEYPTVPQVVHQPSDQIPLFSLQDMRLFQHFLLHCYPHHPIGNDRVWTHEVACLTQDHEFLMHAVLGLAASDLASRDPSLLAASLVHRLKAVRALKTLLDEAASYPPPNPPPPPPPGSPLSLPATLGSTSSAFFGRGNALMATCYALTFQSVLLEDGMAEYMAFVRGVMLVAVQMYIRGARFLFQNWMGKAQKDMVRPHMEVLPLVRRDWADGAVAAVAGLEVLCEGDETAGEYWRLLMNIAENLRVSSFQAYQAIASHYGWWMQLPHARFRTVVNPGSQVFLLLAAHWIALKQVMVTVTEAEQRPTAVASESRRRTEGEIDLGIVRWLRYTNRLVDGEHRLYNAWPMWVEEMLNGDLCCFGRTRR